MAVLKPVLVPPVQMNFLVNSLDTNILLRFHAELFRPNFLMRSGDIELNPGPESYRGIGESVLPYVAEIITHRGKIRSVGEGLGIPPNEIDMYVALSDIEGTYQMLKYWKKKSPVEEQLKNLTTTLTGADCRDIARILMSDYHVQRTDANINAPHEPGYVGTWVCWDAPLGILSRPIDVAYDGAGAAGTAGGFASSTARNKPNETPVRSSQSQIVPLTDEMISTLLKTPLPNQHHLALGYTMQFTYQEIELYRQKNIQDSISGSVEMIKEWRRSLKMEDNEVAALCEFMVKANMKPQADEFYDKCDRIISSKTLKTLKGIIDNAPPDFIKEKVTNHENTIINTFDEHGGRLYLGRFDVTLHIPSGALESGSSQQIALKVLTEMPLQLNLRGNEMTASLGFQCFPSGKAFKKPVTLTMPHCADLLDPSKCELILYLVQEGLETPSITRSELSYETCRVRKNHFDLSLTHFTWGLVTWLRNSWIRGINMLCMPYLPSQMPPDRKMILQLCLYKHIKGCEPSVSRGDNGDVRACLSIAEEFTLQSSGKSPLTVSYQFGGENETPDSEVLSYEDIAQIVTNKSAFLDVNLVGRGDSNRITLWLKPHRSQSIKFATKFETQPRSRRDTLTMTVSEAQLMRLSNRLPHDKYTDFCIQLGIGYNEAMTVLERFNNNYREAYKQALMDWRNRIGGSKFRLIVALEAARIGGLVYDELLNGAEINLQSLANQIQRM